MACIYKIENLINKKLYIGKTLFTIQRRWNQHVNNMNNPNRNHLPLYVDMLKYDLDNFEISEIEPIHDHNVIAEREKYWIKYYNSYEFGYNSTCGGDGNILYDYDWIWELWEDGYTIKQISSEVGCTDQVVRTVLNLHEVSTEERMERSKEFLDNSHKRFRRKVNKIDIFTNEIIKTYDSISEAAEDIQVDDSYLGKVCRKNGNLKGYKWQLTNDEYEKKDFSARKVNQIDLNTQKIINTFSSISEAARAVQGDSSYISKVCRDLQKSSKGFGWSFA